MAEEIAPGLGRLAAFGLTSADLAVETIVTLDDVLDLASAMRVMNRLIDMLLSNAGHVGVSQTNRRAVMVGIIKVAVLCGTSPTAPYRGNFTVGEYTFPKATIMAVLGSDIRRFFRAFADVAHETLVENPGLCRDARERWGIIDNDLATYAFDFADKCSNLTLTQKQDIKNVGIQRKQKVNPSAGHLALDDDDKEEPLRISGIASGSNLNSLR